jgi:chemotaxis protein methyltransferase CheR
MIMNTVPLSATVAATAAVNAPGNQWVQLQQFMLRHTGNVLRDDQAYLMESRLMRAIKTLGFASVGEFVAATCVSNPKPEHAAALIEALTTHETSFFRDITFWQQMRSVLLPELAKKASNGRGVKIWCAACSTGQEPYSLAMLVREMFPEQASNFDIIATDVAEPSLKHAKDGFYTSLETNRGLDLKHLAKFFVQAPGGFRAKDELRNAIRWQQHNLLGMNLDPVGCDMVLCRNVLIYFSDSDRSMVLKRLTKSVLVDGVLGLGGTESCREPGLQSIAAGLYRKLKSAV